CLASSALTTAPRLRSGRYRKTFSASDTVNGAPFLVVIVGDAYCPVVVEPMVFPAAVLSRFAASSEDAARSTFANRTRRRICGSAGGGAVRSKFVTLPRMDAIATARSALAGSL